MIPQLNNADLAVPSPLPRYRDVLEASVAADHGGSALVDAAPLLYALRDELDTPAAGTGFFALHSTANHSCTPSARAVCRADGTLALIALADLPPGGEVTLAYADVEDIPGLVARRAVLAQHGFVCMCERCEAEELAARVTEV